MQADRAAIGEALVEVVALHHAGHRVLGRQLDHAARAQGVAPLAVVANFRARRVQHLGGLGVIGFGVELDLLGRERRARAVAARRITDQRREIADQKNHLVAQILQLPHLVEHHRVADVNVGCRGVQTQLDTQGFARGLGARQLLGPLVLRQQLFHTPQRDFQGLSYTIGQRACCNSRLIHKGFFRCLGIARRYTRAPLQRRILVGPPFRHWIHRPKFALYPSQCLHVPPSHPLPAQTLTHQFWG